MAMTLAELLALLPDNTTGDIDAADLRTIVTELFNTTAALQAEADLTVTNMNTLTSELENWAATTNARIDALEQATASGHTVSGVYRLNSTPSGDPATGQVTTNTGALDTAASIRVAATDRGGTDLTNVLNKATKVSVQDKDNSANWAKWDVTGITAPSLGDFDLAVTLTGSAGVLSGSNNDLVFVFTVP